MLPTKILKLRLSRIQKGKEHLSTQDKLMLVSMESPDLSAHFLLRLFKVSLPKQWKFKHETAEDILYTTQLIQLLEDELIAAYEFHARKYAWYEQCLIYQLNHITLQPNQQQINGYLRQLDQCLDQQPKIDLLNHFQTIYPSAQHAIALAKSYAGATQYTQAIEQYEWAAQQSSQRNEIAFYGYIDCLLSRNQSEYQPQVSDVEFAIDLLFKYAKPIDQKTYVKLLQKAISLLLASAILKTRATETNILADVGRGLNSLGKSLNGMLGGRESHIPYSQEIIANAPQLLSEQMILASLPQSYAMQNALQRILKDASATEQTDWVQRLEQLWLSIQTDPDVLKLLTQPVQSHAFITAIELKPYQHKTSLDIGKLQIILEQGLMAYLGDVRLNKQHPERAVLYNQRDAVVNEMTMFALWFQQEVLKPYLEQQNTQLQQVQRLLVGTLDEIALSSGLLALQFEIQKRAQDLFDWIQQKLEKNNDAEKVQAAWVALRELSNLNLDIGQTRIQQMELQLEQYQMIRLSQIQLPKDDGETEQMKAGEH